MEFSEIISVPKVDSVTLYRPNRAPIEGTLCITPFYLILSSRQNHLEELWLLHKNVDLVEITPPSASSLFITLKCKDFKILKLSMPSFELLQKVSSSIQTLSNIENNAFSYPFHNKMNINIYEDGWGAYSVEAEFNRIKKHVQNEFRVSDLNKNFKVCPSYPEKIVVPKKVSDEVIVKAASYRALSRFPVFAYFHKASKGLLLRSSQPLSGPQNKRCKEDEDLVDQCLVSRRRGFVVDLRSVSNVKIDVAKGGGIEVESYYRKWRRVTCPVERPHAVHEALIKLIDACLDVGTTTQKWMIKLESSNWLSIVKNVLQASQYVAGLLDNGGCVLLHGSEGTDLTLLVSSLSQVIMDSDCRTVVGMQALVEREWIQGGHPFSIRCSKSAFSLQKPQKQSPIFLLFLDTVWQIWQQFSCSFEFNEKFLILLFKHSYASQFGTFLFNNEKEREDNMVKKKTTSLWSYLNSPNVVAEYLNPGYHPHPSPLKPSTAPQSIQLWAELYQSWQKYIPETNTIWKELEQIQQHHRNLRTEVIKMRKYLVKLEKEALDKGLISSL